MNIFLRSNFTESLIEDQAAQDLWTARSHFENLTTLV